MGCLVCLNIILKGGILNKELKKHNKIYCSHIFSLILALPVLVFIAQWLLYGSLMMHEIKNYKGTICSNSDTFENKMMISGICLIYFVRSFFLWDNMTNSLSLKKMNRVDNITAILDTFQEFSFTLFIYGANIWVVFVEQDIQNMILNSLAMEFLMMLDNEFEELYFRYMPGTAEDVYDNVFVSYDENKTLLSDRQKKDVCFKCFSYAVFIPYKLLVITMFYSPSFVFLWFLQDRFASELVRNNNKPISKRGCGTGSSHPMNNMPKNLISCNIFYRNLVF